MSENPDTSAPRRKPVPRRFGAQTDDAGDAAPREHKMRARPNWDDMSDVEPGPDRLKIPDDVLNRLRRDYGMSVQWVTASVYGKDEPQYRSAFEKGGWTPVNTGDFDGCLDGLFTPKGYDGEINMEGLVLHARPMEITRRAEEREARKGKEPVRIMESQIYGKDLKGVTGASHPSVRNSITKSREQIAIPNDD